MSRKPKGKGLQFHSSLQDMTPSDLRTSCGPCRLPHVGLWRNLSSSQQQCTLFYTHFWVQAVLAL